MASRMVPVNDLVTVDIMAKKWHMSVGQVTNLVKNRDGKRETFPSPVVGWGSRAVWLWSDVDAWYKKVLPNQPKHERRALRKSKSKGYRNTPQAA